MNLVNCAIFAGQNVYISVDELQNFLIYLQIYQSLILLGLVDYAIHVVQYAHFPNLVHISFALTLNHCTVPSKECLLYMSRPLHVFV